MSLPTPHTRQHTPFRYHEETCRYWKEIQIRKETPKETCLDQKETPKETYRDRIHTSPCFVCVDECALTHTHTYCRWIHLAHVTKETYIHPKQTHIHPKEAPKETYRYYIFSRDRQILKRHPERDPKRDLLDTTGWQRCRERLKLLVSFRKRATTYRVRSPKLQIIFHKRATKYRSLLRKTTSRDSGILCIFATL